MNIVAYGGGTNSTAMLIGMLRQKMKIDLIVFANTGNERPETYEYVEMFSDYLVVNGAPEITILHYMTKNGEKLTLEQQCLNNHGLPPPCYGWKTCSEKFKISVLDKFCNNYQPCKEVWLKGEKCVKFVGYDAGEQRRKDGAFIYDELDKKYKKHYLLIDEWHWGRDECIEVIKSAGLPLPGKSSCFFCPNMKKHEILDLEKKHPDLFQRAVAIERNAEVLSPNIKGLGRSFSWEELVKANKEQMGFCFMHDDKDDEDSMPCGCYDG